MSQKHYSIPLAVDIGPNRFSSAHPIAFSLVPKEIGIQDDRYGEQRRLPKLGVVLVEFLPGVDYREFQTASVILCHTINSRWPRWLA